MHCISILHRQVVSLNIAYDVLSACDFCVYYGNYLLRRKEKWEIRNKYSCNSHNIRKNRKRLTHHMQCLMIQLVDVVCLYNAFNNNSYMQETNNFDLSFLRSQRYTGVYGDPPQALQPPTAPPRGWPWRAEVRCRQAVCHTKCIVIARKGRV